MACGTGICFSCVLPVGPGTPTRMAGSCLEGPVFDSAAIAWAELGYPELEPSRMTVDLSADLCGVRLRTPGAAAASGSLQVRARRWPGWVDLAAPRRDRHQVGQPGAPPRPPDPECGRDPIGDRSTPSALQNPGVEAFCAGDLRFLADAGATVVTSLVGRAPGEFGQPWPTAWTASPGVALSRELNLSCPNVEHRGEVFATQTRRPRPRSSGPSSRPPRPRCWPASPPDVTDLVAVARAVVDDRGRRLT